MTTPTRFTRVAAGSVLAAATVLALTACSSAGPAASTAPTTTAAQGDAQILAIGQRYSQCVRDHGISTFPDMVLVAGQLTLPDNAAGDAADAALRANPAARDACGPILSELPPAAQKNHVPTAQDRANLVQYARCIRAHGVPEWPDPNADGAFPIAGTPLSAQAKSARVLNAEQACRQYWSAGIPEK